jgi:GNAT superfamily N-acetyltransferase
MEYRRATLTDAALLATMNQRLIRDEGHRNPMTIAELQARIENWLRGDYEAFVFEDADGPTGYALYRRDEDAIYIRQFFVQRERRRQFVGRNAFAWLVENVWKCESRLRLDVLVGNHVAIQFWRSLGFADYCLTMERSGSA